MSAADLTHTSRQLHINGLRGLAIPMVLVYATTGLFVHHPGGQLHPIDVLLGSVLN